MSDHLAEDAPLEAHLYSLQELSEEQQKDTVGKKVDFELFYALSALSGGIARTEKVKINGKEGEVEHKIPKGRGPEYWNQRIQAGEIPGDEYVGQRKYTVFVSQLIKYLNDRNQELTEDMLPEVLIAFAGMTSSGMLQDRFGLDFLIHGLQLPMIMTDDNLKQFIAPSSDSVDDKVEPAVQLGENPTITIPGSATIDSVNDWLRENYPGYEVYFDITTSNKSSIAANFFTAGLGDSRQALDVESFVGVFGDGSIANISGEDVLQYYGTQGFACVGTEFTLRLREVPKREEMIVLDLDGSDLRTAFLKNYPAFAETFWKEMHFREKDGIWLDGVELMDRSGMRAIIEKYPKHDDVIPTESEVAHEINGRLIEKSSQGSLMLRIRHDFDDSFEDILQDPDHKHYAEVVEFMAKFNGLTSEVPDILITQVSALVMSLYGMSCDLFNEAYESEELEKFQAHCFAIIEAIEDEKFGSLNELLSQLRPAIEAVKIAAVTYVPAFFREEFDQDSKDSWSSIADHDPFKKCLERFDQAIAWIDHIQKNDQPSLSLSKLISDPALIKKWKATREQVPYEARAFGGLSKNATGSTDRDVVISFKISSEELEQLGEPELAVLRAEINSAVSEVLAVPVSIFEEAVEKDFRALWNGHIPYLKIQGSTLHYDGGGNVHLRITGPKDSKDEIDALLFKLSKNLTGLRNDSKYQYLEIQVLEGEKTYPPYNAKQIHEFLDFVKHYPELAFKRTLVILRGGYLFNFRAPDYLKVLDDHAEQNDFCKEMAVRLRAALKRNPGLSKVEAQYVPSDIERCEVCCDEPSTPRAVARSGFVTTTPAK